jgi:hypothetical protein
MKRNAASGLFTKSSSFAVQRTGKYASRLRMSGALHPGIFEQPAKEFFHVLLTTGRGIGMKILDNAGRKRIEARMVSKIWGGA